MGQGPRLTTSECPASPTSTGVGIRPQSVSSPSHTLLHSHGSGLPSAPPQQALRSSLRAILLTHDHGYLDPARIPWHLHRDTAIVVIRQESSVAKMAKALGGLHDLVAASTFHLLAGLKIEITPEVIYLAAPAGGTVMKEAVHARDA
jgi:hypothetical protein